jgi:hypothetical protein
METSRKAVRQFRRVQRLCKQSDPKCEVMLLTEPDSKFLRFLVKSGSTIVYESDDLVVSELAAISDGELWKQVAHLSNRRIRRPAA